MCCLSSAARQLSYLMREHRRVPAECGVAAGPSLSSCGWACVSMPDVNDGSIASSRARWTCLASSALAAAYSLRCAP